MSAHPLRLAVGSHPAGSGMGCAMNVVSWENGDTTITDLPACADLMLAKVVQRVNDRICTHRDGDYLCPACSVIVLDLAHRTVGTGTLDLTPLDRQRVWVRLAVWEARSVLHLVPLSGLAASVAAIEAAEEWAANPTRAAAAAADAAAYAADAAVYAAVYEAATEAATDATNAAIEAAYADAVAEIDRAHALIDRFETMTGYRAKEPDPAVTATAIACMCEVG